MARSLLSSAQTRTVLRELASQNFRVVFGRLHRPDDVRDQTVGTITNVLREYRPHIAPVRSVLYLRMYANRTQ